MVNGHDPNAEPVQSVLAIGGPYAGQWLEIHGPVVEHLQMPEWVEEDQAAVPHLYSLTAWSFAARRMLVYRHQSVTPRTMDTALAEAIFKPEVFAAWKAADAPG